MICKEDALFLLTNLALHIMTTGLCKINETYNNKEINDCSRNIWLVSGWMLITY